MTSAQTWKEIYPAEAFFPVELRPVYMPAGNAMNDFHQLTRHFVVVDVERRNPFAVASLFAMTGDQPCA